MNTLLAYFKLFLFAGTFGLFTFLMVVIGVAAVVYLLAQSANIMMNGESPPIRRMAAGLVFILIAAPLSLMMYMVFTRVWMAIDPILLLEILGPAAAFFLGTGGVLRYRGAKKIKAYAEPTTTDEKNKDGSRRELSARRARPDDPDEWSRMSHAAKLQEAKMADDFDEIVAMLSVNDGKIEAMQPDFFKKTITDLNSFRARLERQLKGKKAARRQLWLNPHFLFHGGDFKKRVKKALDDGIGMHERFVNQLELLITDCELYLSTSRTELEVGLSTAAMRIAQDVELLRERADVFFGKTEEMEAKVRTDEEQNALLDKARDQMIAGLLPPGSPLPSAAAQLENHSGVSRDAPTEPGQEVAPVTPITSASSNRSGHSRPIPGGTRSPSVQGGGRSGTGSS